jgi:FtsP/CotA-like multicopper oxidase with cupredoxin domain
MTRRILSCGVALVFLAVAPGIALSQGIQLPGAKIAQFVDPLPVLNLNLAGPAGIKTLVAGPGEITLNMLEFKANMMPSTFVPALGTYTGTWTFGYLVGPTTAPATPVETAVGPVIVATRGVPTQIRYVNNLTTNGIFWREWTDQSLHSAFHQAVGENMPIMGDTTHYMGPVLAVPHLHGGEDPAIVDGGPEAWFASNIPGPDPTPYVLQGPAYYAGYDNVGAGANPAAVNESIYRYPNTQEAAPLWFHDHLLGGTRLNATYAGLAGAYPIIDPALVLPTGMNAVGLNNGTLDLTEVLGPSGANTELVVPLVIQDRMFDTNGQLFFPNIGINPEHPFWVPEFVGDTIIVNGKVWPFLSVDRKRYRFYLINGSNSRPYNMFLQDQATGIKGPRMWVIANDGGYLDTPVMIDPNATGQQKKAGGVKGLLFMPGERYEIIVDFGDPAWLAAINAAYAALGAPVPNPLNLVLRNTAPTVDGNPKASLDGRIMQFRVSATAPAIDGSYNPASLTPLRPPMVRLVNAATGALAAGVTADKTRELTLNEVMGGAGPLEALVNNSKWMGMRPDGTPIPGSTLITGNFNTELPVEGETEVWEVVNLTADAHPIHLHGVQFQILNRQVFDPIGFNAVYAAAFINTPGIIDPMTGLPYPDGVFIPGFGPPLGYGPSTASGGKYGGNPDVTPFLVGLPAPPSAYEAGWKDTAIMPSGQVSRVAVRFAPQDVPAGAAGSFTFNPSALNGYYVWHCHITDHEDNEMMRPYQFVPNVADSARTYKQGAQY